jgi:type IV secretory pathway VirB2 component (pilin)
MTGPFDDQAGYLPQPSNPPLPSPPAGYFGPGRQYSYHSPGAPGYPYAPSPAGRVTAYAASGAAPAKNPGLAALLAAVLGPLGMLYATIPGAVAMFCINLVVLVLGVLTFGVGLFLGFFTWIAGIVWAYMAADQYNKRLALPPITHWA